MGNFSTGYSCSSDIKISEGQQSEQLACAYLKRQGLRFMMRNFRSKGGEIDLIMRDGEMVAFIEVRYRRSEQFGGAVASVDRRKQRRIINAAQWFLQVHPNIAYLPCRFDVVALSGELNSPKIVWLKDAFQ